ncbi:MAG: hypothetical protein WC810_25275 [Janthinobacterium sp.]|jgi:hypothetical protein
MQSEGLKRENAFKEQKPVLVLSEDATQQLAFIRARAESAKLQQSKKLREFSGLDFLTDDQANLDSMNSFIRPKKNDDEVRINTGTVEKKMMTVCNEILSLNMVPEVHCYDENDKIIQDLGDTFQKLVTRTNQQELDDKLKFKMIWNLAMRRILFIEEYQEEKTVVDKRKKKYDLEKGEVEFETREWKISRPRKRVLDPRSILIGDMSIPPSRWEDQPYLIKYDRMHWRNAEALFGKFKNFKYVKAGAASLDNTWFGGMFDWRLFSGLQDEECEVLYYYSFPDDEYQIILNSVPLCAPNTPLDYEHEGYRIKAFVFREMENLAYGQLFTINAKVLAGVGDEMLRLIIRHWQKYIEKTVVFKGKKVLSRDIFGRGAMISGMDPNDIKILDDKDTGLSNSEIEGYNIIASKIEEELGVEG